MTARHQSPCSKPRTFMSAPHLEEQTPSRFVVGIDLGTTNSAVALVDTHQDPWRVETLPVWQLVAPAEVEQRETLPSFHYEPAAGEFAEEALKLPWSESPETYAVGFFARDHGAKVPGRLVASAKSWLCHSGVDRTAGLLPWHGAPDVSRVSPVEVSSRYLLHVRQAWNFRFPEHPLEEQDLIVTLPASFDEVARELTVKAAATAGLKRVVLVEEPQAAFYAWIHAHQGQNGPASWEAQVSPGQKILVCDIGGGTTDFTLIRVRSGDDGKVMFHRVAVGDHLILGGDNLDLALAHHVEQKMAGGKKLQPRQWAVLVRSCRHVKEALLGPDPPESLTVNVPGSGAKLIGGSLQADIGREEVETRLVEGFLPSCQLEDQPAKRQSGFQEYGLPYAPDHAITRYLAAFLTSHRHAGSTAEADAELAHDAARPDIVLFNGGFFESPLLRKRLLEVLGSWFGGANGWQPVVLKNDRLDLAVAQGAAYYGMVRRGAGVRISAGLARTYYVGVHADGDAGAAAMCLLPAGVEEGQEVDLSQQAFDLLIRQPVEFPLYTSSTRLTDEAGAIIPVEEEQMSELPPIRTVLKSGSKRAPAERVRVNLHARLTEIGTMEVWCSEMDGKRTWRLQFDVRAATHTELEGHTGTGEASGFLEQAVLEGCEDRMRRTFAEDVSKEERIKPRDLIRELESVLEAERSDWPPTVLRSLWETLLKYESGRRKSPSHEARWINLVGFALRPGYGLAVDDWRVGQTWRLFQSKKLVHADANCRIEWPILWRRIAGGLQAGQQTALADPILSQLKPLLKGKPLPQKRKKPRPQKKGKASRESIFGCGSHETAEIWRLLGSLELLPAAIKIDLGTALLQALAGEEVGAVREAIAWALGRVGGREPVYGPLNTVVPAETAEGWMDLFLQHADGEPPYQLGLVMLTRRSGDRFRDVSDSARDRAADWLRRHGAPRHFIKLVRQGGQLEREEQDLVFGESLPRGLQIA